jgi:hypothetical protein
MSWARYLAFADILREQYESSLELPDELAEERPFACFTPLLSSERSARLQKDAAFAYYHSSLMPVIEGWRELSLSDDKIDALLLHEEGYYASLRRYRNSTFHYQHEFFGRKQSEWYEKGQKMVIWVILLHSEFSRVYRQTLDNYPGTPEDAESIRELVRDIVGWLPRTSQDVAREANRVEQYLDEQLQHGSLSEPSRRRASLLKADVGALSSKSTMALADLAALREVWRLHIFEEQASRLPSRSTLDTTTDTDRD